MPIGLLDEWVAEDIETSRRKAEILERFVASPDQLIQPQTVAALKASAHSAIAMATEAADIWSSTSANLTGKSRVEAGDRIAAILAFVAGAHRLVGAIKRAITQFPSSIDVLDEEVARSLNDADAKLRVIRVDIDHITAALAEPRPTLDHAKVADALRQSREGRNLESAQVISKIRAARN